MLSVVTAYTACVVEMRIGKYLGEIMKFSEMADAYSVLMSLNEAQRKIIARVIQEAYDFGLKEGLKRRDNER